MSGLTPFPGGTTTFLRADGTWAAAGAGSVAWGAVTGTLANQTDLQTALDAKQATSGKNAANGYAGLDASSKLTGSQQTYGSGANTACEGNDARLSDSRAPLSHTHPSTEISDSTATGRSVLTAANAAAARTAIGAGTSSFDGVYASLTSIPATFAPSAHAASHKSAGSDAIKLDELAAPTDVTTLNATTALHGLLRKLDGLTTTFLRGDGTWAAPTAAAADPAYAMGTFTLATGTGRVQPMRMELSGAQVATLQGTARLVLCG